MVPVSFFQVSAKLSPELYKRLNGYYDFKGLSKTYVINEAVTKYLDEIENVKPHILNK
jgi:predicted DNA-binding protein